MLQNISYYVIGAFIAITLLYGFFKKVNIYESFLSGVKDSYKLGLTIFPVLLLMYVAVNTFRASGLLEDIFKFPNIPNELLIQGVFRPISSHASLSVMISEIEKYGPDSREGFIASVLQGGSDTTVYVLSLYFSSVGIKKFRHSYVVGLLCDLICFIVCTIIYLYFLKI